MAPVSLLCNSSLHRGLLPPWRCHYWLFHIHLAGWKLFVATMASAIARNYVVNHIEEEEIIRLITNISPSLWGDTFLSFSIDNHGMLVLTLTGAGSKLHPPECENQESAPCIGPPEVAVLVHLKLQPH